MNMHSQLSAATLVGSVLLVSCGGGGSGAPLTPPPGARSRTPWRGASRRNTSSSATHRPP